MHELIGASNVISLRKPGDGYDSRAWCAMEVATDPDIERTHFRKICLRLDQVGKSFPETLLLEQPSYLDGVADITIGRLQRATSELEAARAIASFVSMVGVDAEDEREFPMFFVKRKPWMFVGQKEFLLYVIRALGDASENDIRQERVSSGDSVSINLDLAEVVTLAASAVGLKSSNQRDVPYTALMILYARHRGAPELAGLFAACLERCLDGRTTLLARYREERGPQSASCWYRFEDQVSDGSGVAWSRE